MNWIKLGLAQTLLAASGPALAQSQWTYVSEVNYPNSADQFIAQVDASSMAVVGSTVRYWLRIVRIDTSQPDPIGPVRAGPSLYQDDCAQGRFRVVQGPIVWGYDGPGIPLSRPAEWQFFAPDSLAQRTHKFVCRKVTTKRKPAR